jgi:hypothetical protein
LTWRAGGIAIIPQGPLKVLVAVKPADFRKGGSGNARCPTRCCHRSQIPADLKWNCAPFPISTNVNTGRSTLPVVSNFSEDLSLAYFIAFRESEIS